MKPAGTLLIIGGHEEKGAVADVPAILAHESHPAHFQILRALITAIPRTHHTIEIITSASSMPEDAELLYHAAYEAAGFTQVAFMRIESAEDAAREDYLHRIRYAHAVFFTGGDQLKLTRLLNGTPLLDTVLKKYLDDAHFIVAGTSAGAMAMPEIIIGRGLVEEALLKADLRIEQGFGLIGGLIVDTHFIKRGRFGRLALAVALHPDCTGIGLGEDAALLIRGGNEAESIGSGMVVVIDGSDIGATNAPYTGDYDQVVIENLRVHILAAGTKYLIQDKKFMLGNTQMEATQHGGSTNS